MDDKIINNDIIEIKDFLENTKEKENNLSEPFEEFIQENSGSENFIELFQGNKKDIELKSELISEEIFIFSSMKQLDKYLKERINYSHYGYFIDKSLRFKVSKDRASRKEFVDINKKERFENNLNKFHQLQSLADVRK